MRTPNFNYGQHSLICGLNELHIFIYLIYDKFISYRLLWEISRYTWLLDFHGYSILILSGTTNIIKFYVIFFSFVHYTLLLDNWPPACFTFCVCYGFSTIGGIS